MWWQKQIINEGHHLLSTVLIDIPGLLVNVRWCRDMTPLRLGCKVSRNKDFKNLKSIAQPRYMYMYVAPLAADAQHMAVTA